MATCNALGRVFQLVAKKLMSHELQPPSPSHPELCEGPF